MENQQNVPGNEEVVGPVEHLIDIVIVIIQHDLIVKLIKVFTSKYPLRRTQGNEQITMIIRNKLRKMPVSPAVPYTQPRPVFM